MRILKFGGSSVAAPDRIRRVVEIVEAARRDAPVVVVVSAFGGVTDGLLEVAGAAVRREATWETVLAGIEARHAAGARELATPEDLGALSARLAAIFEEVRELAHGVSLLREASPRTRDRILSAGERASASVVAAAFRAAGVPAEDADARQLIVTGPEFGAARVLEAPTRGRIRAHFDDRTALQVVTGFVGATEAGETTTLGRGGSDYTASILGDALDAETVELWTDVDGVLTADPRVVPGALPLPTLAYDELMELSHFGAKVVHPPSVHPARRRGIPLLIRNTFRPDGAGTRVEIAPAAEGPVPPVRGLASISGVALLRLEGDGMIGVPGIAGRLFGALARHGVSVIMISQASSEHSICFAVAPDATAQASRAVDEEFLAERRAGLVDELVVEEDLSIVAVVGAGMRERAGVAGRLFGLLGRRAVNVRAIAQGSSEINISLVVARTDEARALNAMHDAFFAGGERRVRIYLAGPGGVGRALLGQIAAREADLARERGYRIVLGGLADSRGAVLDEEGIAAGEALGRMGTAGRAPLDDLVRAAAGDADGVFVDCSASAAVADRYPELLAAGTPVVTANKLRPAGPLAGWRELRRVPPRFRFETTVGAGLPVVSVLEDLVATGDEVRGIDGVLSGTLAYVLDEVANGKKFSEAVRAAHDLGYTEPDPREDLGGHDVGRKILILARLAGRDLEPDDVTIEPVLPAEGWSELTIDEFWSHLPELDAVYAKRQAEAAGRRERLVYLASLGEKGARVRLEAVPASHPAASLRGTDNLVALTTRRYARSPLVVRGPGAGPELTASGVFADLLRAVAER